MRVDESPAFLVHGQEVSLAKSLVPIHRSILPMPDESTEIERNACQPCILDVEFERMLLA